MAGNHCSHNYKDGLCIKCLCPQTAKDQVRAENAHYRAEELKRDHSERKAIELAHAQFARK